MKLPESLFVPLEFRAIESEAEQLKRADDFYEHLNRRRTVRDFSDREVPLELIERAVLTAGTAPSGAHMQPWRFVVAQGSAGKRRTGERAPAPPARATAAHGSRPALRPPGRSRADHVLSSAAAAASLDFLVLPAREGMWHRPHR